MFGLKKVGPKLKPRIKPVISVNKASKYEENKNVSEEPPLIVIDDSPDSPAAAPGSKPEIPSIPSPKEAPDPSSLQLVDSTQKSCPLLNTTQPDARSSESSIPDTPATENKPDSATVPESTVLKPDLSRLDRDLDLSLQKPRLTFARKPTPVLRAKRKPVILPVINIVPSSRAKDDEPRLVLLEPENTMNEPSSPSPVPEDTLDSCAENICDKLPPESSKTVVPSQVDQEVKNKIGRPHVFKPTLDRQRTPKFTTSTYGKMSSEAKAQMIKKFGTTTPDLSKLTMLDLIFYNPKINGLPKKSEKCQIDKTKKTEPTPTEKDGPQEDENSNIQNSPNASPKPKIKLDSNGRAVIDRDSIIIRNKAPDEVDTEVLDERDVPKKGIKRKRENNFWNYEDTIKFYKGLLKYGSDFTMMLSEFPDRDRRSLKSKFKREEKINGKLIDKVIGTGFHRFDVDSLETELSLTHCPPDHSKKKLTRKSADTKKNDEKKPVRLRQKRRRACDVIKHGFDYGPPFKKIVRKSIDQEGNNVDDNSADEDSPSPSSPSSLKEVELDNSDDERASVVSDVVREEFIKEFLQNGKVVINTSIVSNSLKCSQSIRLDSNSDKPLDVNLTVSHSIETLRDGVAES